MSAECFPTEIKAPAQVRRPWRNERSTSARNGWRLLLGRLLGGLRLQLWLRWRRYCRLVLVLLILILLLSRTIRRHALGCSNLADRFTGG